MKNLREIDINLKTDNSFNKEDLKWYPATDGHFSLFGIKKTDCGYVRMDEKTAETVSENVKILNYHTAGGRIAFESESSYIAVKTVMANEGSSALTLTAAAGFDLYIDEGEGFYFYNSFIPEWDFTDGYQAIIDLKYGFRMKAERYVSKKRKFLIHYPLYTAVKEAYIGLSDSPVKYNPYPEIAPIVFYGSSITHGASADHPGNAYANIVSRKLNRDYINLGFSGSARGELEMADYIASLPMSLFFYGYDHNEVFFPEDFKIKHFRFYERVREKNKDLPIIFASAPFSPRASATFDITRKTVIESYEKAKARGDRVAYVDGKHVFGEEYFDCGTVDGAHPSMFGFVKMAEAVMKAIKEVEK